MGYSYTKGGLMGTFKRIIFSLMTVVLILLGAIFVSVGLIRVDVLYDILYYLQNPNVRIGIMIVGAVLLLFAIITLIDLIVSSNADYEYLEKDETGSVLVKRTSLENSLREAVRSQGANPVRQDVKILQDGEKIKAKAKVEVDKATDLNILSENLKREIKKSLGYLTGITDTDVSLYFQKKEESFEER